MFVRHGERCDLVDDEKERARIAVKSDPPLTKLGVAQAHVCGKFLKQYLTANNYDKIVIESSPFLRAMETAAGIATELGLDEISINYRCSEWLRQEFFPEACPLNELTINQSWDSEFKVHNIRVKHNTEHKRQLNAAYPETKEDVIDRIVDFGSDLFNQYQVSKEKVAHIVVNHGINVRSFGQLAFDETQNTRLEGATVTNQFDIGYTGLSAALIKGNTR